MGPASPSTRSLPPSDQTSPARQFVAQVDPRSARVMTQANCGRCSAWAFSSASVSFTAVA
jgi:hypothetical protein